MISNRRVGFFLSNTHTYGQGVLEGLSAFCQAKHGWKLSMVQGDIQPVFQHLASHLDGVIAGIFNREVASMLRAWGKPCVDVSTALTDLQFPRVSADEHAIGRTGAEYLLGLGFEHFAFCGYPFTFGRQKGFEDRVRQAGCSCHIYHVDTTTLDWPSIWKGVADWVAALPKPVGLLAAKDMLGLEVLDACRDLGIHVPEQVAVLGVDNDLLLCQRAWPMLSSIDTGIARVGFHAASMLEEMMSGNPGPRRTILFPPMGVVGRASTDISSLNDPQIAAVLRYIRKHACERIRVNDLLSIVPLSRRTLELRFFEARGRSLHDEIRRIQLQKATRLLAQTRLPLDQVAQASGFGSREWMVKVFHKELGTTPGKHRRRYGPVPKSVES